MEDPDRRAAAGQLTVMLGIDDHAPELVEALQRRSATVVEALTALPYEDPLDAPSLLPGWTRLTIACHLRYGSHALLRMTSDALEGRPTAYYPEGRANQRPATLAPAPGESPRQVLADLAEAEAALVARWQDLAPADWRTEVREPGDNPDLGTVSLGVLAMSALTEREVHGGDLDLGLPDWSATFVDRVLPARLEWLASRRTNHRPFDDSVRTDWLLVADDRDLSHRVVTDEAKGLEATTTIRGSARDLLALLLGRPVRAPLVGSRPSAVDEFQRAFPGP